MGTILIGFLLGTLIWGQEKHTSFNINSDKGVIWKSDRWQRRGKKIMRWEFFIALWDGGNVLDMAKGDTFLGDKQEVPSIWALESCLAWAEVSDWDKRSFSLGSTHFSHVPLLMWSKSQLSSLVSPTHNCWCIPTELAVSKCDDWTTLRKVGDNHIHHPVAGDSLWDS